MACPNCPRKATEPAHIAQGALHAARVAELIRGKLARIEKEVADHLREVDALTLAHFFLTQSLKRIEQRAAARWGRP